MNIKLLFPTTIEWERWQQYKPDVPFSEPVIEYLNALSTSLLKDRDSRSYSDVITFAFFCRKANLYQLKEQYIQDSFMRLGRGILFHIAPSNVPINFGYSLITGLLSGNYNVVRVSSKEFTQVDLILKHMLKLKSQHVVEEVSDRIALVKYDKTSSATDFFSSFCNVRLIWGGDSTINQIRKSTIPARTFDVTFSDRYSIAAIQADRMSGAENREINKLAEGFYNDTYLFDQNACSAPHLVVWLGKPDNIKSAQKRFWSAVQQLVNEKYTMQSVLAIDKLTTFYRQAVRMPVCKEITVNNNLIRVKLHKLTSDIDEYRCAGGYFTEYIAASLNEIVPIIKSKYQTIAYYGLEDGEIQQFVINNRIIGFERIVPFGETTSFSLTWDGYNLIETLTRKVVLL